MRVSPRSSRACETRRGECERCTSDRRPSSPGAGRRSGRPCPAPPAPARARGPRDPSRAAAAGRAARRAPATCGRGRARPARRASGAPARAAARLVPEAPQRAQERPAGPLVEQEAQEAAITPSMSSGASAHHSSAARLGAQLEREPHLGRAGNHVQRAGPLGRAGQVARVGELAQPLQRLVAPLARQEERAAQRRRRERGQLRRALHLLGPEQLRKRVQLDERRAAHLRGRRPRGPGRGAAPSVLR